MTRPVMITRANATQATVDRFMGKTHRWSSVDCGRMSGFQLRKIGHKLELPKVGAYSTPAGALKWLKQRGFDSLEGRLDALGLPRIAPAEAMVGDILALESIDALAALVVHVGGQRVLGFHEDHHAAVLMQPTAYAAAWRVI